MLTGKWQAGGRTDGETGGQRLLLFFARTTTATITRNKKQKEAGKGNASFVNEISRTNNVKVAHTDPRTLTHTHIDTHSHRQMPAHSQQAHTLRPSHAAGVCTDAKQLGKRDKQREAVAVAAAAAASTATAASAAAPKKQKQTMPCAVFGFKARKNETKAKQRA